MTGYPPEYLHDPMLIGLGCPLFGVAFDVVADTTPAYVATPKPAPKWVLTPRGMLLYNGRPVADMRLKVGREQADFMLAALNAAEEKR